MISSPTTRGHQYRKVLFEVNLPGNETPDVGGVCDTSDRRGLHAARAGDEVLSRSGRPGMVGGSCTFQQGGPLMPHRSDFGGNVEDRVRPPDLRRSTRTPASSRSGCSRTSAGRLRAIPARPSGRLTEHGGWAGDRPPAAAHSLRSRRRRPMRSFAPEAQHDPSGVQTTASKLPRVELRPREPAVGRDVAAGQADRERRAGRVRHPGRARAVRVRCGAAADERPGAAAVAGQRERARRGAGHRRSRRRSRAPAGRCGTRRRRCRRSRRGEAASGPPASGGRRRSSGTRARRPGRRCRTRRRAPDVVMHSLLAAKPYSLGELRGGHVPGRVDPPAAAAVRGDQDAEPAVHRVAEDEAVLAVEERHAVVERLRVRVAVRDPPVAAAVGGQVGAEVAGVVADRHEHGVVRRRRP